MYIKGDIFAHSRNIMDRPFTAFVYPILFMSLYSIIPPIKNKVIMYLSSISYELYVCQSIAFFLLGDKHSYSPMEYLLSSFVMCTVVASVFDFLTKKFFVERDFKKEIN